MVAFPVLDAWEGERRAQDFRGAAHHVLPLNQEWLFEGVIEAGNLVRMTMTRRTDPELLQCL